MSHSCHLCIVHCYSALTLENAWRALFRMHLFSSTNFLYRLQLLCCVGRFIWRVRVILLGFGWNFVVNVCRIVGRQCLYILYCAMSHGLCLFFNDIAMVTMPLVYRWGWCNVVWFVVHLTSHNNVLKLL